MKITGISIGSFLRRHPLITGTIWLTGAGLLSRIIGFFYRIYLSLIFGEEGMGIYQLIHPIGALAFSITSGAFQTAISKFVSGQIDPDTDRTGQKSIKPLILGASVSIPLSVFISFIMYTAADWIGTHYLHEPRTADLIRLLSFSVPFCAAHACINGYFYGIKQAGVPAITQLTEQIFRVGFVCLLSMISADRYSINLSIAVIGLVIGEMAGFTLSLIFLYIKCNRRLSGNELRTDHTISYHMLLSMVIPLSANRVLLNLLQSAEAAMLPLCLRNYGYDAQTALSVYGVLTGMAFPLIFFPNALTGSVAVMLLPAISENMSLGNQNRVRKTILQTIQYCSIMGFGCMAFFLFFSKPIGLYIFHSPLAGFFIGELSFLCPFLYLNSTLSGIIQGLGKATALFTINLTTLLLRLCMTFFLVPHFGIQGYLWSLLAGQILQTILYLCVLFMKNLAQKRP